MLPVSASDSTEDSPALLNCSTVEDRVDLEELFEALVDILSKLPELLLETGSSETSTSRVSSPESLTDLLLSEKALSPDRAGMNSIINGNIKVASFINRR